jgi:hypothetical protein
LGCCISCTTACRLKSHAGQLITWSRSFLTAARAYLSHAKPKLVSNATNRVTLLNGVAVACVLVTLPWCQITAPASSPRPVPVQIQLCTISRVACNCIRCVRRANTCQTHLHLEHPITCYAAGSQLASVSAPSPAIQYAPGCAGATALCAMHVSVMIAASNAFVLAFTAVLLAVRTRLL